MRTSFDFSPMFRSSIGFDRVFDLLESTGRAQSAVNWPLYDIEKAGEDHYRITIAVAGFSRDELHLVTEPNLLVVSGEKADNQGKLFLYHGIPDPSFERRFELADHVKVANASLQDGMLTIDLVREIPEAMKPRQIEITTSAISKHEAPQIEKNQAA